jgi:transcriptional regulator with XRE-family HTH domain
MAPFERASLPAHWKDPNYTTGRPTEYRPEYCDLVIDQARQHGLSLAAFAGVIGVSKETVYAWIRERREFSDAASRAKSARVLWWELKLGRSRKGAEVTASIFALRNADPVEWKDVKHTAHDHTHKIESLTDAQLYAIAAGKTAADGSVIDGDFTRVETD